ncbi:MAG TPA: molybdopterin adenylyltransferase [Pirellulaceae bacterium]|nr:molybdopterin adenylyltransferase [Pirellulaceae bacterium]
MDDQALIIGIVTISDRASAGTYSDRSGPAIVEYFREVLAGPWQPLTRLITDEQPLIEATLRELADEHQVPLIVTTGGTGPALRDVTPEATLAVADRVMPGFGEAMRAASLAYVPTAILSRQIAVVRSRSLIINLPGSPRAISQCLDIVMPAVPYCLELLGWPFWTTNPDRITAFRPKN